jgi:hypothetical protein
VYKNDLKSVSQVISMPPRPIAIDFTDAEFATSFDEGYIWSLRLSIIVPTLYLPATR